MSTCNFIQTPQESKDYIMLFLSSEVFLISYFKEQIFQYCLNICVLLPVCEWSRLVQWSCLNVLMAAGSLPKLSLQRKSHQTFCLHACTPTDLDGTGCGLPNFTTFQPYQNQKKKKILSGRKLAQRRTYFQVWKGRLQCG